jgi:hypothetical protein
MFNEWVPWVSLFVAVVAGAVALWSAYVHRGSARQGRREPTWGELLARVTALEAIVENLRQADNRKSGAFARILRAIAEQWPTSEGPDLDPEDMKLVEETIPPMWIRRPARRRDRLLTGPIEHVPGILHDEDHRGDGGLTR